MVIIGNIDVGLCMGADQHTTQISPCHFALQLLSRSKLKTKRRCDMSVISMRNERYVIRHTINFSIFESRVHLVLSTEKLRTIYITLDL